MEYDGECKFSGKEQRPQKALTGHKECIILISTLLCVMHGTDERDNDERDQDSPSRLTFYSRLFVPRIFVVAFPGVLARSPARSKLFSCYEIEMQ